MDLHEQGMSSRTFVIAAIVCVLLQAGLAPQISIAGGRVNFMIILVCLSVFSGDPTRAVVCGFCSGLFYDLSAAVPVGVMSLLLKMVVSGINGYWYMELLSVATTYFVC